MTTTATLISDDKCIDLAGNARDVVDYLISQQKYEYAAKVRDLCGEKQADDVWPKTVECPNPDFYRVYFTNELSLIYEDKGEDGLKHLQISQESNYIKFSDGGFTPVKGIKLEVVAEDGEEDVRVVRHDIGNYFLRLAPACLIRLTPSDSSSKIGEITDPISVKPLPRGTKTTIEVFPGRIGDVVVTEPPKEKWPLVLKSGVEVGKERGEYSFTCVFPDGSGWYPVKPSAQDIHELSAHLKSQEGV